MSRGCTAPLRKSRARAMPIHDSRPSVSRTWTNSGSRTNWICICGPLAHAHELLAEILAAQQPDEGARRILDSLRDILALFDLALAYPGRDIAQKVGLLDREV